MRRAGRVRGGAYRAGVTSPPAGVRWGEGSRIGVVAEQRDVLRRVLDQRPSPAGEGGRPGSRQAFTWPEILRDRRASTTTTCAPLPATMPPRLSALRAFSSLPSNPTPCRSFLAPLLQQQPQQIRAASILAGLSDAPGAYNKRIRRGRGPASGKGKTSGRGHKGQKQHGKVPVGFNGGQTSYEVTHPEKGFVNQYVSSMPSVCCGCH